MRGRFWCGLHTTTLALLPLVLGGHARADKNEPKVIALSCDGMLTPTYGANKLAMPQSAQKSTVIVNLDDQTVFFLGYVTPIEGVDGASIRFGGRQIVDYGFNVVISGNIDRATGRMDATLIMSDPMQPADANTAKIHYDLVCRQAAIE
jgi:hypothetical protein